MRRLLTLAIATACVVSVPVVTGSSAQTTGTAWEYGVLEAPLPGLGTGIVFCRATPQGCVDTVYENWPVGSPLEPGDRRRVGFFPSLVAKAMAALGRDGWELVGDAEVVSPTGCNGCRAMLFKRSLAGR